MSFYKRTWFIILALVFFAPLGLFLMWRYKTAWGKPIKVVLTVFFCIWFLGLLIGNFSDTPSESVSAEPAESVSPAVESSIDTSQTEPTTIEMQTSAPTTVSTTVTVKNQQSADNAEKAQTQRQQTTQSRAKATTTQNPEAQVIVYITRTGEKYHNENPCGNGTYYPITLEEAKARGYEPCEKCVLH